MQSNVGVDPLPCPKPEKHNTIKTVFQIVKQALLSATDMLYSLRLRHTVGYWLVFSLLFLSTAMLALLFVPANALPIAVLLTIVFILAVFCHRTETNDVVKNRRLKVAICTWLILLFFFALCLFFVLCQFAINQMAKYTLIVFVGLLLLDVLYVLLRENLPSLTVLFIKGILSVLFLYIAFHPNQPHTWGYASSILKKISDFSGAVDEGVTKAVWGIVMSAGAFFAFKDGLDALKIVPYSEWNFFSNKELRLRKTFALVSMSAYMISWSFFLWRPETDKFFACLIAIVALFVAEYIAKLPAAREKNVLRAIASTILSKMKFPYSWQKQELHSKAITEGDTIVEDKIKNQLKMFHPIWMKIKNKYDFDHQMQLINHIVLLMGPGLQSEKQESSCDLFLFLLGIYCSPDIEANDEAAHSKFKLLKWGHLNIYRKDVFLWGMKCGYAVKSKKNYDYYEQYLLDTPPEKIAEYIKWLSQNYAIDDVPNNTIKPTKELLYILQAVSAYLCAEEARAYEATRK